MHVCVCAYMCVCMCVCWHAYMHACVCVCVCVCVCLCVCVCVSVCVDLESQVLPGTGTYSLQEEVGCPLAGLLEESMDTMHVWGKAREPAGLMRLLFRSSVYLLGPLLPLRLRKWTRETVPVTPVYQHLGD